MKTSDIFVENLVNKKLLAAFYHLTYQHIYLYIYKKLSPKWKNIHEQKLFSVRFYILCENFSNIGPIIKKIPNFVNDPLKTFCISNFIFSDWLPKYCNLKYILPVSLGSLLLSLDGS